MAHTAACPSCKGPLRIPDELVGQQVRCPVCQTVFAAAANGTPAPKPPVADAPGSPAPEPERPLWKDLRLELDDSAGPASRERQRPEAAPPRRRGPVGAIEINPSGGEAPAPPASGRREPAADPDQPANAGRSPARPPRGRFDDDDDYRGPRRSPYSRGYRRRDTEPHRGTMILVFGIISIAAVVLSVCYGLGVLIGIGMGITAWVLGSGDLKKIKAQQMDEEGLGMTQAGWICGIIGTLLNTLVLLSCGGFIAVMLIMDANRAAAAKPAFVPPPPAVNGK